MMKRKKNHRMWKLLLGLFALAKSPARMTVVQRENGPGRLVRASLGCGILASAGAAGCAAFLCVCGQWASGWREPLLAAVAAAAAWAAFAASRGAFRSLETV